ncbi:MAG: cohesin domain-containing protein [Ardenticatenaceae bacterium]|nr:cohesin domain-containing protein [Ardenticatenaceae bacterium]HBY99091.1 hypothetical protein [Chloroflexota bacterium]
MRKNALVLTLFVLVLAGGLVLGAHPTAAEGTTLRLIAPGGTISGAGAFNVQVRVEGATNLGAYEFDVVYNPQVVALENAVPSNFLGATVNCNPNVARCVLTLGPLAPADGRKSVGAYTYGTGSGPSGNGTLVTLRFSPVSPGSSQIQLDKALITDTAANPTIPATEGTAVTVGSASYHFWLPVLRH